MNPDGIQARLTRLKRECDVSAFPAILLCAACAVFVLMPAVSAVTEATPPTQACQPVEQVTPPAEGNCSGVAPNSVCSNYRLSGLTEASGGTSPAIGASCDGATESRLGCRAQVLPRVHLKSESSSLVVTYAFHAGHFERVRAQGRWKGQYFRGSEPAQPATRKRSAV